MFVISNSHNFFLMDEGMFLTGGTRNDESSFKELLYKWYNHSLDEYHDFGYLDKIQYKVYLMDMIKVEKVSLACHMNLSAWTVDNFSTYSEQLFKFYTERLGNYKYEFVDFTKL